MLIKMFRLVTYLQGVGGKLSRWFIFPPPRISERMNNLQILLHHLLQEYVVERNINFTEMLTSNVQLGCVLTRGGGKLSRVVYLGPRTEFQREWIICKFYYTIHYRINLVERDIDFTEMLAPNVQLGCVLTRGGGQSVQGGLSCPPPPRISGRMNNQRVLLHHLL